MAASRKLYVEIAKSFKACLIQAQARELGMEALEALAQAVRLVAADLANDNKNFKYEEFFNACGLTLAGNLGGFAL